MDKINLTIGVTGLNNTDNPGPGVPVIRALRESHAFNTRIIGLAYENLEPGIYMKDLVDKVYMLPYPTDGTEALLQRISYIQSKESMDVLIPNFDAELFTFMKTEARLKEMGIHTFMPTLLQYEERHKSQLPAYGKKYGMRVPKSVELFSLEDVSQKSEKYDFPYMIKGKFYDAYIAGNIDQAKSYFHKVSAKWGLPVIMQEYITGTEVNVIALGDGKGNMIGAVPMKKQYITDKGKAWGGITLDDPVLLETTRQIIEKTKWRGGMEVEMIRTDDNELYVIEINPRIPAWAYLAVAAGQNLPEALVKLALGLPVKPFTEYSKGKIFIRYSWDLIIDFNDFQKFSTLGES
ncbi:MAG: ATP-grasp domain-containing protein [Cyclobacteriaceae bacterium]|nr:ATP-grasp domain-containing protein [Cyclobacteriaceae bacterium]